MKKETRKLIEEINTSPEVEIGKKKYLIIETEKWDALADSINYKL